MLAAPKNVHRLIGRWLGRGDRVDVAGRQAGERCRHRVLVGRAVGILIHRVERAERRRR